MTDTKLDKKAENKPEFYTLLPNVKRGVADAGSKIYNNPNLDDLDNEIWVDALGFDGAYEVSNLGRIKSLGRRVENGSSNGRWVKEKIRKQVIVKDGRLTCHLSQNNIIKSINVSAFIFYSFNPNIKNDNLNDEVYHKNKIMDDNRIENLGYNKIKGASYKISIELGNVKNIKERTSKLHPHTIKRSVIIDGRTVKRTCRVCDVLKPQKEYRYYGTNRCIDCDNLEGGINYRKRRDIKKLDQMTDAEKEAFFNAKIENLTPEEIDICIDPYKKL